MELINQEINNDSFFTKETFQNLLMKCDGKNNLLLDIEFDNFSDISMYFDIKLLLNKEFDITTKIVESTKIKPTKKNNKYIVIYVGIGNILTKEIVILSPFSNKREIEEINKKSNVPIDKRYVVLDNNVTYCGSIAAMKCEIKKLLYLNENQYNIFGYNISQDEMIINLCLERDLENPIKIFDIGTTKSGTDKNNVFIEKPILSHNVKIELQSFIDLFHSDIFSQKIKIAEFPTNITPDYINYYKKLYLDTLKNIKGANFEFIQIAKLNKMAKESKENYENKNKICDVFSNKNLIENFLQMPNYLQSIKFPKIMKLRTKDEYEDFLMLLETICNDTNAILENLKQFRQKL